MMRRNSVNIRRGSCPTSSSTNDRSSSNSNNANANGSNSGGYDMGPMDPPEQMQSFGQQNVSNVTGWYLSRTPIGTCRININKMTNAALVIVIYNKMYSKFGKFKNTVIANSGVMRAFGKGDFWAMAEEHDEAIELCWGHWNPDYGIGLFFFDNVEEATRCMESNTEMRDRLWLNGPEIYVMPACNPASAIYNFPYMEVDMYDVKNRENFVEFLNKLAALVMRCNGLLVAGSEHIDRLRGQRKPTFITVIQWSSRDEFETFHKELAPMQMNSGSACTSRILFDAIQPGPRW